ncbi:MAG: hypothetical protein J0H85_15970 [Sediminibacterium magnilacihabitans]|mgnify:FL=1|jgi:hypothetical protein|nr:hypothetical protein [Sediminibacterium magnilacihabitans]PQV58024.1 hypothetical protein CLV53_1249 [Sediminibacterium magnilacihabitans]
MKLIKEPLDVDFVVDPRPLTKDEEKAISDFIRADKEKRKLKELRKKATTKRKEKHLA